LERDEILYSRLRSGDRQALATLAERYHGPLYKFLMRITGQAQLAEDLVQEAFIRMLSFRGAPPERFRPWAYQIAHNLVRDHFRSAVVRKEIKSWLTEDSEVESTATDQQDMEFMMMQNSTRHQVTALLQRLSRNQREVLVLRFYHELSLGEIAEITGAPLGTVKSRLYHGLRRARYILEGEEVNRDERSI
jgi:RNA polymerase sigma-70 factor, ECF subfamily